MIEWVATYSVLILAVLALRWCLKGKISLRLQYGLWALVLLRLLVPMSLGESEWSVANALPPETKEEVLYPWYTGNPGTTFPAEPGGENNIAQMPPVTVPERPVPVGAVGGGVDQLPAHSTAIFRGLAMVWGAGALMLGLWLLGVNVRFAGKLRRSRSPLAVEECPLPVYVTGAVPTPCLFGLLRPCIYVTQEVVADEMVLRHSLAHELTHYRHGDHLWAVLRGVCLALHWYNPLVWLAAVLSRRDGELCCDESTVRHLGEGERASYGRTLLAVTCQGRANPLLTATSMAGNDQGIKERIRLLVKRPRTAAYTLAAVILIAAVAVGCTFTGAQKGDGEVQITLAEGIDTPQAVSDYAREYVGGELTYYTEGLGYEITKAEIVGLTPIDTGSAGEDGGVSMYRLEYRLHVSDPDQVVLADGMSMEDGAISEWSSTGQPYLLLRWENVGDETHWEPVCVTHTDTIEQEYGTPEMLEKYGDAYTAAAMEVYLSSFEGSSLGKTLDQLLEEWFDRQYAGERWYFQDDQPSEPQEGDRCLGPARFKGGIDLSDGITGEVYAVEVSYYKDGQFRALADPCTLVLSRAGQNGAFQQVLGRLKRDASTMTVEDIVLTVAYGLMDTEVSLRRDGYDIPIGPGNWVELFRPAYDGEPDVQALPDYEPIYGEGDFWDRWSVEGFSALRYYNAEKNVWSSNTINVTRTDLYTPRGIRVGDSRAQVLEAYPETLTGDYWGKYPEEPDLLAYVAWSQHNPEEIRDLSQLGFYEGLGPAILFFFKGDTLRQITLVNMVN